ncbi:hypothetical protein [uncultured Brevundimonas sp.]|uniref:hypothetical protein n=1 Tax=uncultured Brevundimonas sp. TaxID=213418 RepID=UPI0025FB5163|nr:hypothetical protein [uncultured Brevundimonas sp.]
MVDLYRSLHGAQKVANGLIGSIRWEREVRLYARAQGTGAIKRTEHRCEFGNAVRDALEPQHPDAAERFADIVTEPDAGPVIREAAMQEIGFEAQFDGDGGMITGAARVATAGSRRKFAAALALKTS